MVAVAARNIGCDRSYLHVYISKHPTIAAQLVDEREFTTDAAELSLYRAITAGEPWAVSLYLKTQGKGRGYVERSEVSGPDGGPITLAQVPANLAALRAAEAAYLASVGLQPLALVGPASNDRPPDARSNGFHPEAISS